MLTQRMHNVCQFVADYFGRPRDINYSDGCWIRYVARVANAGELFEETIKGRKFGAWYDVLEAATDALAEEIKAQDGGEPDLSSLRHRFETIRDAYDPAKDQLDPLQLAKLRLCNLPEIDPIFRKRMTSFRNAGIPNVEEVIQGYLIGARDGIDHAAKLVQKGGSKAK